MTRGVTCLVKPGLDLSACMHPGFTCSPQPEFQLMISTLSVQNGEGCHCADLAYVPCISPTNWAMGSSSRFDDGCPRHDAGLQAHSGYVGVEVWISSESGASEMGNWTARLGESIAHGLGQPCTSWFRGSPTFTRGAALVWIFEWVGTCQGLTDLLLTSYISILSNKRFKHSIRISVQ